MKQPVSNETAILGVFFLQNGPPKTVTTWLAISCQIIFHFVKSVYIDLYSFETACLIKPFWGVSY